MLEVSSSPSHPFPHLCMLASYAVEDADYQFKIKYHSTTHKYEGSFSFNPAKSTPFADNYASKKSPDEDLHNISKSLENIVKLKL